jgi:hypothetical protein
MDANMNRRRVLIGMAAASTAAPVALAAASTAPAENPALVAAYDKLIAAQAEHAAATDALEWLADEWRHLWPLAPEEILGGANAQIHDGYGYPNSVERDILGRPLMRDKIELTKRLAKKFRLEGGQTCFIVDQPEDIAARLESWQATEPVGRTAKALAMKRAHKTQMVESLQTKLPLARHYHDETKRLREVSGANAARKRVKEALAQINRAYSEIDSHPATTIEGIRIKATAVAARLGPMSSVPAIGEGHRLATAILDILPAARV